jgi:hypothetical protein
VVGDGGQDADVIDGEDAFGDAAVEVHDAEQASVEQKWRGHDAAQAVDDRALRAERNALLGTGDDHCFPAVAHAVDQS